MLLFLGFIRAEIVLIKRQTILTNYWVENVVRTVLIINTRLYLNRDGLHLNRKDIYQISCNFNKDYFNDGRNLQNFNLTDNLTTEDLNKSNHLGESSPH